jgi:hypothetical protein
LRLIATSRTYQRSALSTPENRADDRYESHARLKPLPAPVLVDATAEVTGVPEEYPGLPPGTRAIALGDSRVPSEALDVFGRCTREGSCVPATTAEGGLPGALHLINGSTLNRRLRSEAGRISGWAAPGRPDGEVIEEIYLRAFARFPTPRETAHWAEVLRAAPERRQAIEDLVWAALNSREFAFNH